MVAIVRSPQPIAHGCGLCRDEAAAWHLIMNLPDAAFVAAVCDHDLLLFVEVWQKHGLSRAAAMISCKQLIQTQ